MEEPLVDVVVPVHNGQEHIQECLASILAQTYRSWRGVVVDNCSTDATGRIADEYAQRDPRLRIVHCTDFVSQAANYNRTVAQAGEDARYIMVLEADNWITEDCIARMVDLAETQPQVGIVGCYWLLGKEVSGSGLDYRQTVLSGPEVARLLFDGIYFLGSPSTLLFRAVALRTQSKWFREDVFYDDTDLCLRVLESWKFGFVHRLLAFIRADDSGAFSKYRAFDFRTAYRYFLARRYAERFFQGAEVAAVRERCQAEYYERLGRAVANGRFAGRYWQFHRGLFAAERATLRSSDLLVPVLKALLDLCLNPKATIEAVIARLRGSLRDIGVL
jgi:glycosyltransferase involved in cell wall biosynthesis